ncbi:hypothetical protein [uncultured Ruegeria sp.]|uniref:hypothetical protein n=1 Tax=uncultured Ruegeria sp. TaxID=259304 RepID=UPI002615B983|nr:hypothetical protein [uncultured Ruegeria sp.]
MARPKPPKIEPNEIPTRPKDELEVFLEKLYFRTLNSTRQLESGNLNKEWIAFETLGAIFPVLDGGLTHSDVKTAYPVQNWQDHTVEIPIGLLRAIVAGWQKYQASKSLTLGQSFGFEHLNRQGKSPMRTVSQRIDKNLKLAASVDVLYRQIGEEDPKNLASVLAEVAEKFGVSEKTVERAYAEYRELIQENLERVRLMRD